MPSYDICRPLLSGVVRDCLRRRDVQTAAVLSCVCAAADPVNCAPAAVAADGPGASRRSTSPPGSHSSHNSLFSGIRATSHDSLLPGFLLPEESEGDAGSSGEWEAAARAAAAAAAAAVGGDCGEWEEVARAADEEDAGRLLEAELEPQLEWCRLLYADALLRWAAPPSPNPHTLTRPHPHPTPTPTSTPTSTPTPTPTPRHPDTLRYDTPTHTDTQHTDTLTFPDTATRWGLDLQRAEVLKYCAPPAAVTGAPGVVEVHLVVPTSLLARPASGLVPAPAHCRIPLSTSCRSDTTCASMVSASSGGGGRNSLGLGSSLGASLTSALGCSGHWALGGGTGSTAAGAAASGGDACGGAGGSLHGGSAARTLIRMCHSGGSLPRLTAPCCAPSCAPALPTPAFVHIATTGGGADRPAAARKLGSAGVGVQVCGDAAAGCGCGDAASGGEGAGGGADAARGDGTHAELPLNPLTWALMPRCAVCDTRRVRGLGWYCGRCGHGGHLHCTTQWFAQDSGCPTGCGCRCADLLLPDDAESDELLPPPAEPVQRSSSMSSPAAHRAAHRQRQASSAVGISGVGRRPLGRHRRVQSHSGDL